MTRGEGMLLEDAIHTAIKAEKGKQKALLAVIIVSVVNVLLIGAVIVLAIGV